MFIRRRGILCRLFNYLPSLYPRLRRSSPAEPARQDIGEGCLIGWLSGEWPHDSVPPSIHSFSFGVPWFFAVSIPSYPAPCVHLYSSAPTVSIFTTTPCPPSFSLPCSACMLRLVTPVAIAVVFPLLSDLRLLDAGHTQRSLTGSRLSEQSLSTPSIRSPERRSTIAL